MAPTLAGGARTGARSGIRCTGPSPGHHGNTDVAGHAGRSSGCPEQDGLFPTRMGKPAEYAALVRHIAENAYLNGEVIRLMAPSAWGAK